MAEEGVVQLFTPIDGTQPIVGVIGALQLDVLADRLQQRVRPADRLRAGAVRGRALDQRRTTRPRSKRFIDKNRASIATDLDGDHVFLPGSDVQPQLGRGEEPRHPLHRHQGGVVGQGGGGGGPVRVSSRAIPRH